MHDCCSICTYCSNILSTEHQNEICQYKSAKTPNDVHVDNWGNSWVFTGYKLDSQEAELFYELHTCTELLQGN